MIHHVNAAVVLVVADLAVGLISVPTDLAWRMTVAWHAGNLACKLIRFLQVSRACTVEVVDPAAMAFACGLPALLLVVVVMGCGMKNSSPALLRR